MGNHALVFTDLPVLHSGCEAVRARKPLLHPVIQSSLWEDALQLRACVPVVQCKTLGSARKGAMLQD